MEVVATEILLIGLDDSFGNLLNGRHRFPSRSLFRPRPRVSEPQLRNDVESSGVRSSIVDGDPNRRRVGIIFVLGVLLREASSAEHDVLDGEE